MIWEKYFHVECLYTKTLIGSDSMQKSVINREISQIFQSLTDLCRFLDLKKFHITVNFPGISRYTMQCLLFCYCC